MIRPINATNGVFSATKNLTFKGIQHTVLRGNLEILGEDILKQTNLQELSKQAANVLKENFIVNNGVRINIAKNAQDIGANKGSLLEHVLSNDTSVQVAMADVNIDKPMQITPNTTLSPVNSGKSLDASDVDTLVHITPEGTIIPMEINAGGETGILDAGNVVFSKDAKFAAEKSLDKIFGPNGDLVLDNTYIHHTPIDTVVPIPLDPIAGDAVISVLDGQTGVSGSIVDNLPDVFEGFVSFMEG